MGRLGGPPPDRGRRLVNRGEVWWAEIAGLPRRPACILTRDAAIPLLTSLLVVSATRTVRGIPTEVPLDQEDGMPERCVLSFDNLYTVPKGVLAERITRLPVARLPELCLALRRATAC